MATHGDPLAQIGQRQTLEQRVVVDDLHVLHLFSQEFDRVLPSFTLFYCVLASFTLFYCVLASFTSFYIV